MLIFKKFKIYTGGFLIDFYSDYLPRSTSYKDFSDSYAKDIRKICSSRHSCFFHEFSDTLSDTHFPMSDRMTHSTIDFVLTNGLHVLDQFSSGPF
jgi:hypothetical protein